MSISLGKGLAIAAGMSAVGIGGFMLLKGGDKPKAEETPDGVDPTATAGTDPTAAQAVPGSMSSNPGGEAPGTPGLPGGQASGEQVGAYTVVPDASGMSIVFETATQQPVAVMDAQGNIQPVTVDAQGKMSIAPQEQPTTTALGQGTPQSSPAATPNAQDRSAAYQAIAADLFANATDPTIGSAASDPMAGVANLAPAVSTQAGSVRATGSGAQTSSRQVGEFTLVDDGSGTTLVLNTASQQPVGIMDAAGNVTPISVDANGNISVSDGLQPATTTTTTPTPTTPAMAGAATPTMSSALPQPLG